MNNRKRKKTDQFSREMKDSGIGIDFVQAVHRLILEVAIKLTMLEWMEDLAFQIDFGCKKLNYRE
jgi:hypothetical protein